MSERKVINKYYPPDFDGSKIPRGLQVLGRAAKEIRKRPRQITIRLMAPMSMRCNTCGEYIYKGKKFNARQETVKNEDYLGLRIFRFYIKCPCCVSEITFKTDPANTDYAMEAGATRSFQAARIAEKQEELRRELEEEEEKTNPMQALEKRTRESRREMEKLEHLEELKDLNRRHLSVDHESLINKHLSYVPKKEIEEEEDDDILVKQLFYKSDDDEEITNNESNKFVFNKISDIKKPKNTIVKINKNTNINAPTSLVGAYSSPDTE